MLPLLNMLEHWGLSLADAEAGAFEELGAAAQRCQRCVSRNYCIRWLKWHGRSGPPPACPNIGYFTTLKVRRKVGDRPR